ncbi:unnamed protein product [Closterium sp. NIES-65]|nr:unnamed protein product [Closterium sp. NIES-65]
MHKNQLQEVAQKNGYNLPSYACIREGPDHAPKFKATVLFNGETYVSPGYFVSLRQAEHAAAEVALRSLSECCPSQSIATVLDESGVCKNLLQETAQRAGVPLPNYNTVRSGPGHQPVFTCTLEVAGLQFSGEAGRTKKQAEKNAAMSAWSALKRHAGRNQSGPMEDFDVTDEQEQSAIARALANAYNASSIKSSPAILSHPADAPHSAYLPSPSPKGMASAPLYTRNRSSVSQKANPGPLYVPRHVSSGRTSESASGNSNGRMMTSSSFKMREVTIREYSVEDSLPDNLGSIMGAPPQFPRMTHSSPHIEPPAPTYTRRSAASRSNGPADIGSSVPNFPTQPLVSQSVPRQPGLGLPQSEQSAGSQTSRYTNIAIKPGMAYQPRSARGGQSKPAYNTGASSYVPAERMDDAGSDGRWSHNSRPVSSNGGGLLPNPTDVSGASTWTRQSSSMPYWPAHAMGGMPSSRPVSGSFAGGRVGGVVAPGVGAGVDPKGKQCRTELEEDVSAAEATTRQMLNHLCL